MKKPQIKLRITVAKSEEVAKPQIPVIVLPFWNGNNFIEVIRSIAERNTEVKVKQDGERLMIREESTGFYRCVRKGYPVVIPDLGKNNIIEDGPEPEPEPEPPPPPHVDPPEIEDMMRRWGLVPIYAIIVYQPSVPLLLVIFLPQKSYETSIARLPVDQSIGSSCLALIDQSPKMK